MFWKLLLCCAIIKLALCEVETQTQCESPDKVEATTPFTPSQEEKKTEEEENEVFKREVGLPGPCPRTGEPICKCGLNCLRECDQENISSPCECSSCPTDCESGPSDLQKLSCDLENRCSFPDFSSFCQDCGWAKNSELKGQPCYQGQCSNNLPILSEYLSEPQSSQCHQCGPLSGEFHPIPCDQPCDRLPRKCFHSLEQSATCPESIPGSPLEQTLQDFPSFQCQCDETQNCIGSCNRPFLFDAFPPVLPPQESNLPRLSLGEPCDCLPKCLNPCKLPCDVDPTQPHCSCPCVDQQCASPQTFDTSTCECNPCCQPQILAQQDCQPICDSKPLCPSQQSWFGSPTCECNSCCEPPISVNQECQPICDSKPLCPFQQNCFGSSPCQCNPCCLPPISVNPECPPICESKPLCSCQQNCFGSSPCECSPCCQPTMLVNPECQPICDSKPLCPFLPNCFDSSPCQCNPCCQPPITVNPECPPICDSMPLCPCQQNCLDSSPCESNCCCNTPPFLNPELVPCDSKPCDSLGCPFQCGCPCEGQISRIRPVVIECVRQIPIVQNSIQHQQEFFTREVPIVESHVTQQEEQILRHVPIVHKYFEPVLESRTRFVPFVLHKQRTVSEPCMTHVPIIEKRLRPVPKCVVEQVPIFEKRCVPVALQTVRKIPVTERICRPVIKSHITQIPVKERIVKNFVERLCCPGPCCGPNAQLPPWLPCSSNSCDLSLPSPCPSPF